MAGDWIKMRVDLGDDPAVIRLSSVLNLEADAVVGKLHRLWCWADKHTLDGKTPGVTAAWVDRYVTCQGFAQALQQVHWLTVTEDGIEFPAFERHNGESAKRRADNTIRQRLSREMRDKHMTGSGRDLIPRPFRKRVLERDCYTCVYCGTDSDPVREGSQKARLSVDHIIPSSRDGKTIIENLATCCKPCNNEKNDRTPEEWDVLPAFLASGYVYRHGMVTKSDDKAATREEKRREDKTNNKKRPATRCPDGFSITPEMADWARRKVPSIDIESETEQFLDRQRATAGVYSDWTAAWRNWMRNAVKFQGTNRGGGGKHSGGKPNYSDKQNTHIRDAMAGVGFTGPADYPDAVGVERRLQAPGAPRGGASVDEGELETSSNQRAGPFPLSVL